MSKACPSYFELLLKWISYSPINVVQRTRGLLHLLDLCAQLVPESLDRRRCQDLDPRDQDKVKVLQCSGVLTEPLLVKHGPYNANKDNIDDLQKPGDKKSQHAYSICAVPLLYGRLAQYSPSNAVVVMANVNK